jgi:hypothetical protein
MRTTVRLDDHLLADAKRSAAERGTTLTAVIEEALRDALARRRRSTERTRPELPVSRHSGGLQPGVDLDDNAALLDLMEAPDGPA